MRIVKYNNNKVFPSLMNQFFNDDLRMNVINNNHSVPSVNSIENDNSFEIDLAVPGMKKDDFTIQLNDKVLVISSENTNSVENNSMSLNEFNYSSFQRSFIVP
jgi:HSP20 family protein